MDSSNQMLLTEWDHTGFCYRKSHNLGDSQARLNFPVNPTTNGSYVQLFEGLFPKQVLTVVIDMTEFQPKRALSNSNSSG